MRGGARGKGMEREGEGREWQEKRKQMLKQKSSQIEGN